MLTSLPGRENKFEKGIDKLESICYNKGTN